jgi:taurine dioxygenase
MTIDALTITPLPQALGATVTGLDLSDGVSADLLERLHDAWLENLVLFFPGAHLTTEQHIALGSAFGRLAATTTGDDDYRGQETTGPGREVLVLDCSRPAARANAWHTDVTFTANPPKGSLLSMQVCPDKGGDTLWSNQYAALDALHPAFIEMLEKLRGVHGRPGFTGTTTHPIVTTHPETGRRSLFVNRGWTTQIEGMSQAETFGILAALFNHSEKPEFTTRWTWTQGDAALWDNRCTMHYAVNDYDDAPRIIHRVTIYDD